MSENDQVSPQSSESRKESVDLGDLKRKSVRGGMVTVASQGANTVINLASTVILARLLSAEDYGILAMVLAVTAFAKLFRDFGISSAAIQKKELTHRQQSNLFWLNVSFGLVLTTGLALASPLVAWFYKEPDVSAVTAALSATFLISSLSTQSAVALIREMKFGLKVGASVAGALVALIVSVILAYNGYRYWALVFGQLGGAVTTTLILLVVSPFRPALPTRGTGISSMLKFGANIAAFDMVNYFARNLDNILIGRYWGITSLGLYSRAYSLLMLPIKSIRAPIQSVAFPALSRIQDNPKAFRAYYTRITALLSHLTMPLVAFLFVSAPEVIELALGKQWLDIAPIFSILALTAFAQAPLSLNGLVQLSLGRGRRYFLIGVTSTALVSAGFLVGVRWGAVGVAASYGVVTYLTMLPILMWAFKGTPVRVLDFFRSIARPVLASLVAAACAAVLLNLVNLPLFGVLACSAAGFGLSYLVTVSLLPGGKTEIAWAFQTVRTSVAAKVVQTA